MGMGWESRAAVAKSRAEEVDDLAHAGRQLLRERVELVPCRIDVERQGDVRASEGYEGRIGGVRIDVRPGKGRQILGDGGEGDAAFALDFAAAEYTGRTFADGQNEEGCAVCG